MTARPRHRIGRFSLVALLALVATAVPGNAGQIEDKHAEAAAIATALQEQAERIVAVDIQHRRAVDELEAAEAAVLQAEGELAATTRQLADAKQQLVTQAQDAYVLGGSVTLLRYLIRTNVGDEVVRRAYLRVVTGQERSAIARLKDVREDLQDLQAKVGDARKKARDRAQAIDRDRTELDGAVRAQRSVLERVNGELAELVAAEQQRRDAEEARLASARLAAAAPRPAPVAQLGAVGPVAPAPAAAPETGSVSDTWGCIRQLESGNNYATPGGGAYQFLDSTWQSLGYTGTASDAPPAVQDEAARKLQARSGWDQWTTAPLCGRP